MKATNTARFHSALLFATTATLALTGVRAVAQQASSKNAAVLEEVVVTAEKRSQNLQDVPVSITALTEKDIKARQIQSISDVVRQTPNVNFGSISYGTQLSSRGIGTSLVTGLGDSSVAVYLDGILLSRPAMASLLQKDLSRVELLRGPQGTLYGRNATGGVLNLITPDAPKSMQGGFTVGGGNYDSFRATADVGGPLGDRVRGRLFLNTESHEGYTKNISGGKPLDAQRTVGARATIDADLSETATTQFRMSWQQNKASGPIYKPIQSNIPLPASVYSLDPWRAGANAPDELNAKIFMVSNRTDVDGIELGPLGKVRLTSLTGYIRYNFDSPSLDSDGTAANLFFNTIREADQELTQEFNVVHSGDRLDWTAGAYLLAERINADRIVKTPGFVAIGLSSLEFYSKLKSHSYSAFGDATVKATDRLSFFGGLRVTSEDRHQYLTNQTVLGNGAIIKNCTPADPLGDLSRHDDAVTGRFGAKYDVGEANFYGQVSRGFKSGGLGYSTCGNAFEPENLDAGEVGVKAYAFDRRLRFNASAFYYELKNLQVEQIQTVGSVISSVPKSRIKGAELEADFAATSKLQFNVSGGLLDAEYVRFFDIDALNTAAGPQNLSGKKLNRAPNWNATFGVQYTQPLDIGSLMLRADVRSTDKYTLRPANTPLDFQDGYTTIDGSVTFTSLSGRYVVRGWMKNATKKAYLEGLFSTAIIQRAGTYAPPRTAGVELTARF